jgi:hypothetical protein
VMLIASSPSSGRVVDVVGNQHAIALPAQVWVTAST